jgi:predicted nucleotidyltransferase component of viral defense system
MAKKEIKNVADSIRAKLLVLSKEDGRSHEMTLLQYYQERLLYRLSISPYKSRFILKGGLLFLAHQMTSLRPTKDIDFLGHLVSNERSKLIAIFQEIVQTPCPEDGVAFRASEITAKKIKEDADYEGLRLFVPCGLGKARQRLQIDIGFGDKMVPGPILKGFPVLLNGATPHIQTYPTESAIAEKFQAMVYLGFLNSRLKDFYDIYFLAQNQPFRKDILKNAIQTTFRHRKTNLENRKVVFSTLFMNNAQKEQDWKRFHERNEMEVPESFAVIMNRIQGFLDPIMDEKHKEQSWNPQQWKWIES